MTKISNVKFHIEGTSTATYKTSKLTNPICLKAGTYTFSMIINGNCPRMAISLLNISTKYVSLWHDSTKKTVTLENDVEINRFTIEGFTVSAYYNFDVELQIEEGELATSIVESQESNYPLALETLELYSDDKIYKENGNWYVEKNWEKIDSYNGETIETSYISSTGGLDVGATIVYQLETPTKNQIIDENLVAQLEILSKARAYKGGTIIKTSSEELALKVNVIYKKDLETMFNNLNTAFLALGGVE